MPFILVAVNQQVAVELLDVVLGEGDLRPGRKHQIHHLGVASHLLLVTVGEALDLEVRQQTLHLAVSQLAALNAGGGANAFDRCHPPQG